MRFYLGTHKPNWLALTDVPLFLSTRHLSARKTFPRARGPFAIDSAGYSELATNGRWHITARQYAADVRRYRDEIGPLAWAAVQDWMCEPWIVQKTGLSITTHQTLSTVSLFTLRELAPDLPWLPVLQGWHVADYLRHVEAYAKWGIDLTAEPIVGLGSVCRRQGTTEAVDIFRTVAALGIRLHGFGVKKQGLVRLSPYLASADSLAWSFNARRRPGNCPVNSATHKNCANCLPFALRWREQLLAGLTRSTAGGV